MRTRGRNPAPGGLFGRLDRLVLGDQPQVLLRRLHGVAVGEEEIARVTRSDPDHVADPHALPLAENTVDLVVMPHALEFTDDPHLMLREAHRVLRPEGQIVIAGFNPFSLYGVKRYFGREQTPPWNGNFIGLWRLKDWLALLGFDVIGGRLDGYAPPFASERWLRRFAFLEKAGDRWWPIAGGVYFLRATKKVAGMRVIAPAWERRERRKKALAPAARAKEGLTAAGRHE